jgi:hypothetical protein
MLVRQLDRYVVGHGSWVGRWVCRWVTKQVVK